MISFSGDCHISFARPKGLEGLMRPCCKLLPEEGDIGYDIDGVQYQHLWKPSHMFKPTWLVNLEEAALKSHLAVLAQSKDTTNVT